ncbi:hypothetical protein like AT3G50380 [Hibiscus trionum]|uniref:Vacuolar protein sorting-associated protein 13 VPS13 adaptor binding domain-containing protein n=1 Tax=Hibiscus trionum TaxID=183268 RepID=A0A9W7LIY7_HIBTR|nr:hypothetical protein like AT3G50380 [Hibiscus trionum]
MFVSNFIKRILSSLLRPWLEQDLELVLQLGFINSIAIAKNIRLDTSTLNRQIVDGSSSSPLIFKEFVIEEFVVRFSIWSGSAFAVEARGVKVTLSLEEMEEEGTAKVRNSSNAAVESLKNELSLMDPEGTALHGILEAILATTSGRNQFQSSFLNLILQHCCLQILDINLQVQFPTLDDSFVFLLDLEKLNAESLHFVHGCLCRGLVNVLFQPLKEGSFVVSGSSFTIGYKKSNQISHVCSSSSLVTCIKLNDLELVEINFCVPELSFSFSPVDFPVFMELSKVPSKEFKRVRNGRHLWRLAAIKIGHVISAPKLSWYKLVGFTSLWLKYVNHYEYLLSLIRYSPDHILERPDIKIPRDKIIMTSAKHYWEVILKIEKELPAEAVAQGRKIARYKALSRGQQSEDNYAELHVNAHFKPFIQKVMQSIQPIRHLFWRSADQDEKFVGNLGNDSESSSRFRFILSLGKICITLSSMSAAQPVNEEVKSHIGISYSDVFSFRFSIKVFLLMYVEDIIKQTLSFSCGKVKVKHFISSVGEEKERIKNFKIILHGEPAKIFLFSEGNKIGTIDHAEGGCDPCLENFIGKMCLDWRQACKQFDDSEIKCPQSPRLLFEMKNFVRHPDLEKLGSGIWKCNLTVGKFDIALGFLSLKSIVMLLSQIQHALHWTQGNGCARDLSYSPRNTVHHPEDSWEKKYERYCSKIKMSFMRMLPGKDIQIGVLIAGPRIQFSSRKIGTRNANEGVNNHVVSGDDFHLGFDIHDIEVVICPSSKSGLAPIHDFTEQDDEYPECLRLQEPKIIHIPELENNKYRSEDANSLHFCLKLNGLHAYLEDIVDRQINQIFVLDPITFQFSSFRQCAHSFSTTSIAFSTVFYGLAMGFTLLLFMDELSACIEALTGLFSDLTHLCNYSGSPGNESFQILRQDMLSGATKDEELSNATPLIYNKTMFLINGILKLKSIDIFLCCSRKSNKARSSKMVFDAASSSTSAANDLSDCGIWISLPRMCFDILYEEMKLELVIDLSGIQSVIIRYQEYIRKRFTRSAFREFFLCSHNCLYEVFLSHCIFTLLLSLPENSSSSTIVNEMLNVSTSEANTSNSVEDASSRSEPPPSIQSPDFLQKLGFASNITVPASSHSIFINMVVAEVFVTRCSVKNIVIGAQKINKLLSSLYVGPKSKTIAWGVQGGFLCLEPIALAMFIQCSTSYLNHIKNVLSIVQSTARNMQRPAYDAHSVGHAEEMLFTSQAQQVRWELPEAFNFDVSQFSLALIVESESSHIREFVLELDLILNLDLDNMQRKFMFKLSRLSIFSQVIQRSGEDEIQILHSSSTQSNLSSQIVSGESSVAFQHENGCLPHGDSYSRASVSEGVICLRHQDYILKHLTASLSVEKTEVIPLDPELVWVGSGSVPGFDMKITLSELEAILSMVSSFSGLSVNGSAGEHVQRNWSYNPQDENNFEARIPDGAIVAIQDVHQHLYFTVEGGENKYAIGGAVHYSFVGERALFRVKYHQQRKWTSSVFWFSLISLHAKDNSGEPLRLNSNPGSGFVELSSTSDNAWSLWRVIFYESTYEGDIDWEPYNHVLRNTFYLVNKKNDCAVAFNDRVPVFVKKPGNPFKFKVLSDMSVAQEVGTNMYSTNSSETKIHLGANEDGKRSYWQSRNLPCIGISIDKVSLTIFHEFSDANDRFPLLHASIFDAQLTLQMLSVKARIISTSKALLQYFDAQTNLWRDFLHPVEICIYYRSSFQNPYGVPVHVYCRTKELEISLTELSLDILLFMIGKLNLAGPFSLRSSMILANCCKVDNHTGLNLLCRFYGKQSVTVGKKQTASVFLRLSAFVNQPSETEPVVSIQLSLPGSFTTSPLHLSLLGAQALAWRTRILSLQDSRSYPGPFVVVDISRKPEDGLSIAVSPLIRIQNETKLSIDLRIRRPEQMEDEFASLSLKAGDTFDDSTASFDAINLSGGSRKALMSLNVGNFLFSFRPEKE